MQKQLYHNEQYRRAISGSSGMLEELKRRLEAVFLPSLKSRSEWGVLTPDINTVKSQEVSDFLENIDKFVSTVQEAITSLGDVVRLQATKKNFGITANTKSYQRAISKPEVVPTFEEAVVCWIKQIEVLLGEVTAIREENDCTLCKSNESNDYLLQKLYPTIWRVVGSR